MKRFSLPLVAMTLALPVFAGDKAAGEAKTQACVGCHEIGRASCRERV